MAAHTSARRSPSRPLMVVIAGMTGAGKTTFASLASGHPLEIGHGLDPCTQDPQAVRFVMDGRQIILIDTPGFDDTNRNDVEILEDIAKWMTKEGLLRDQQPLDGFIFLHPIHELGRLDSGMEKKRTRLIQKILGKDAYKRVVIATTMWGSIAKEYHGLIEESLGFRKDQGVWGDFHRGGAIFTQHHNTKESADTIIRLIMERSNEAEKVETLLQNELAGNRSGRFTDTSVGQELRTHLEDEIGTIMDQLLKHRLERPPESWRKTWEPEHRRKCKEWDEEAQHLTRRLEQREAQLKILNNSFGFRLLQFWGKLWR
ncbi:P-loop containing nucleoside triphosphate hydrolase protein [Cercophora newfieldiana]|uniref:P-loop containing nucleoside triphosphate hydrolase protein n=1 Tax=Cercophora newfieldiana TaxID=92897 RepID=A0AA39XQX2_9PEZI|nr:P-loop containing nucleoside triphosphate hydrolase protein [Cercophora newfieldiana]